MNLLVWDKTQFANNNGEYFYRMARELRPGLKMSFVLSRKSVDWNRLKKDGFNLVAAESPQIHRLMRESTFMLFSNNPMPN